MATVLPAGRAEAEGSDSDVHAAQISTWEKRLQQAGASTVELDRFEQLWSAQSKQTRGWFFDYIQKNPTQRVLGLLRAMVGYEYEVRPADIFPNAAPAITCEELRSVSIPDTVIDSVAASASDDSCQVTAIVIHPPAHNPIKIFIALPTKGWNGRFRGTGGGGYAGGSIDSLNGPVAWGFAVGATDTGNPEGTANFAIDTQGKPAWQRLRDNGYVGIHDMTVVGKALTEAFYGKAPRYSYFVGGSTGGRQALTEAQRYPDDYDGILAINPAIARDRYVPAQLWPQILMREANNFLSREKRERVTKAAVKACDATDGLVDGVIENPLECHYDPKALVGTWIGDSAFGETDARIVQQIWGGARGHDGGFLWWGPTLGSDLSVLPNTETVPLAGKPCEEGLDWFRYFLKLDPKWDWTTLSRDEFELLFAQSIQVHASVYGGDDPDLTGFRNRNGKLLMVHGLADQIVPPQASIDYYERVQNRMGGPERLESFARLFLVPGADHGLSGAGPSPSIAELKEALRRWVEEGHAPDQLDAQLLDDHNKVIRTKLLHPHPLIPRQ
jgi:pimeloyl-ACP methyl ester carboxylesterase